MDDGRLLGGRYEVGELLGRGGMAEVHAGRDMRLGRTVAVKLLRSDLARDPAFQTRFRREAQAAAGLNHPAVVAVYDTGEDVVTDSGGASVPLPWIVMEHVEGRTLRERVRDEGPLPADQALAVASGVLAALEHAHRSGIVHRDIKPANVMLTSRGEVKVMDFGIARALADSSATMTATQAVIGTAQYLSPEQARGEQVDARSDLYSTGCLLYELLTGRPPFVADSAVAVAYQHVREEPAPPSAHAPGLSADVDRVVLHALAKRREDRYQDAASFRADVEAVRHGRAVAAPAVLAGGAAAGDDATRLVPRAPVAPADATQSLPRVERRDQAGIAVGRDVDDSPPPRRRAGAYVLLALAAAAVLALVALALSQLGGDGEQQVRVPDVVGQLEADARAALEAEGFVVTSEQVEDAADPGTVVGQDPGARDLADPGSQVELQVSSGPGAVEVPDVVGRTQAEAGALLAEAGLEPGEVVPEDAPDERAGTVLRASPAPGESVAPGTRVDLVVASGNVALPDVTGQEVEDARQALIELGFAVRTQQQEDGSVAEGVVLSQDPGPGALPTGSQVTLVFAVPPRPTATPTPTRTPTRTQTSEPDPQPEPEPTQTEEPPPSG